MNEILDLESVEYLFTVITPSSLWAIIVVSVRSSSMSQIDLFENYLYLIGILDTI